MDICNIKKYRMLEYLYYVLKAREYYTTARNIYDGYQYFLIVRKYARYLTCLLPEQQVPMPMNMPPNQRQRPQILEIKTDTEEWCHVNLV